ncbi:hypothetical protein [Streptomyces sp. Tue6028]|uniref:phage baseplate protein n=1 Tax=Streptomyces sp. Tue6028 TaxID=2036037 RepID=UPI003D72EC13
MAEVLAGAGPASAVLPSSGRFDLGGAGGNPMLRKPLHQPSWAMQSFAYDNVNGHIYAAQHRPSDNPDPDPSNQGDIWISKTDLSGNVLGTMALHNFGHGSSMAVEPSGSGDPYLWIEADNMTGPGTYDDAGHKLARFRYTDGLTLEYYNPSITVYDRTPTISSYVKLPRPAVDPVNDRLLIRYATADTETRQWRIAVFSLADAVAGRLADSNRLAERALPNNSELGLSDSDYFQGITLYGQYVYLLYGRSNSPSYLVTLDMNHTGGSFVEVFQTTAGQSIPGREPQGAAIWVAAGQPRLAFGFSGKTGTTSDPTFDASIFYKSDLT